MVHPVLIAVRNKINSLKIVVTIIYYWLREVYYSGNRELGSYEAYKRPYI